MQHPTSFFILVPTQIKPQAVERKSISNGKRGSQKSGDQIRSVTSDVTALVGGQESRCGFGSPHGTVVSVCLWESDRVSANPIFFSSQTCDSE